MLAYALPLKSLWVTGKKPCSVPALTPKEVEEVIAAGRDYFSSKDRLPRRAIDELLSGLSSWSPAVRKRSAQALASARRRFRADSAEDARPGLIAMPATGPAKRWVFWGRGPMRRRPSCGPCSRIRTRGCKAWRARPWPALGPEARKASVSRPAGHDGTPNPADPRRMAQRAACTALFSPYPGTVADHPRASWPSPWTASIASCSIRPSSRCWKTMTAPPADRSCAFMAS